MSHYGVLLCAWQSEDLLDACLQPWLAAKRAQPLGHTFTICAVSTPFEGFPQDETQDRTRAMLGAYAQSGDVDHVVVSDKPLKETEARGRALRWLVDKGVDALWMVDSDEVYLEPDIAGALRWVEANPLVTWFRLALRNYVFDKQTYLVEPFTPPRIHRVRAGGYRAHSFYDDNGVLYGGTITRDLKRDDSFASMTVPDTLCLPKHWTWLSDMRGKAKQAYQVARGWECSFRWDEVKGLQFNEAYYARRGLPLPEIIRG